MGAVLAAVMGLPRMPRANAHKTDVMMYVGTDGIFCSWPRMAAPQRSMQAGSGNRHTHSHTHTIKSRRHE